MINILRNKNFSAPCTFFLKKKQLGGGFNGEKHGFQTDGWMVFEGEEKGEVEKRFVDQGRLKGYELIELMSVEVQQV